MSKKNRRRNPVCRTVPMPHLLEVDLREFKSDDECEVLRQNAFDNRDHDREAMFMDRLDEQLME